MHSHRFGNAGFPLAGCDTGTGDAGNRDRILCIHGNRHRTIENSRGERGMWTELEQVDLKVKLIFFKNSIATGKRLLVAMLFLIFRF